MHIKKTNNAHFVFLIQIKAMDGGQNDVKHHGEEKKPANRETLFQTDACSG